MERKATYILGVFGLLVLGIVLGARTSYVPFEELESTVFPYSSLLFFAIFVLSFTFFHGTEKKPAGFKYLAGYYKRGEYKQFLLSLIAIPASSFLMGYFVYMVVATLPAYPTKMLNGLNEVSHATCLRTGRGKFTGSWSLFRLKNGEEWEVRGYGHVCPNEKKYCELYYMTGIAGYYVHAIKCS